MWGNPLQKEVRVATLPWEDPRISFPHPHLATGDCFLNCRLSNKSSIQSQDKPRCVLRGLPQGEFCLKPLQVKLSTGAGKPHSEGPEDSFPEEESERESRYDTSMYLSVKSGFIRTHSRDLCDG